jgi:hypothetical protein
MAVPLGQLHKDHGIESHGKFIDETDFHGFLLYVLCVSSNSE